MCVLNEVLHFRGIANRVQESKIEQFVTILWIQLASLCYLLQSIREHFEALARKPFDLSQLKTYVVRRLILTVSLL